MAPGEDGAIGRQPVEGMRQSEEQDDDDDGGLSDSGINAEHARPRKRTRRACDKCSASRTRCDGECPCRRCQDYGYSCRYNREVKKRGRLPASASAPTNTISQPWSSPPIRNNETGGASFTSCSPSSIVSPATDSAPGRRPPTISAEEERGDPMDQDIIHPAAPQVLGHSSQQQRIPGSMSVSSLVQTGYQPIKRLSHTQDGRDTRPSLAPFDGPLVDSEIAISDESAEYPSPLNGSELFDNGIGRAQKQHRGSFRSSAGNGRNRESFSTVTTAPPTRFTPDFMHKAPTEDCCYKFLNPVLPYIRNIIPASVACDLLDIFLTDPGSSLFRGASPYILTRIFRKSSITDSNRPRYTTPALLATILWCVAQTADVMILHVPGSRAKIVNDLYDLATSLTSDRDPDRWRRIHGGLRAENEAPHPRLPNPTSIPSITAANEPAGVIDDVLTFILLSIAVSGGDFKSDCYKWWSKATRLALSLGLNREDERCSAPVSPCANPLCACHRDQEPLTLGNMEHREERRRVFWLLYSLDRHLALSFNTALSLPDSYCEVYTPLPETVWENLDSIQLKDLPPRIVGPPTTASGTGYFEYFLPLMAILGDIIEAHHRRRHPRLGELDDAHSVGVIQELLSQYEVSLDEVTRVSNVADGANMSLQMARDLVIGIPGPIIRQSGMPLEPSRAADESKMRLVRAYSTHILNVLHVLLHGKWDAISMLDDGDDWITSKRFNECASHAISASQSVSTILTIDPELTFMSYLFGIYLLHGSFILLLFADRMPQLGPNPSVEEACENIIRAHEVCVVTLSTEFQKNFRKVLRSTLYSVRGAGTTNWEEHRARRRALSLYRWTKGAKGLAL